jgi:hypothetical protein
LVSQRSPRRPSCLPTCGASVQTVPEPRRNVSCSAHRRRWLPAAAMSHRSFRAGPRPVVLLLGWLGSKEQHLSKYVQLYQVSGWVREVGVGGRRDRLLPWRAAPSCRRQLATPCSRPAAYRRLCAGPGCSGDQPPAFAPPDCAARRRRPRAAALHAGAWAAGGCVGVVWCGGKPHMRRLPGCFLDSSLLSSPPWPHNPSSCSPDPPKRAGLHLPLLHTLQHARNRAAGERQREQDAGAGGRRRR